MSRLLPPLNACRAFEAAARHESFARAGDELHVTAAAISHQVKLLETWVGQKLFDRGPSGLALSEPGRALLPAFRDGFAHLLDGIEAIAGPALPAVLTISVHPNFALKWLVPRLQGFAACEPGLRLQVTTRSHGTDWSKDAMDVAIRYLDITAVGAPEPEGMRFDLLFAGTMFPVVSPELAARRSLRVPHDLEGCTLLHVVGALDDWPQWLAASGVRPAKADRGPRFDSYALSVEAAISGWGVALAREDFVGGDLASGRLVAPFALQLPSHRAWFLITRRRGPPKIEAFRAWLIAEARRPRGIQFPASETPAQPVPAPAAVAEGHASGVGARQPGSAATAEPGEPKATRPSRIASRR